MSWDVNNGERELLTRLRDLSLVDIDVLLRGTDADGQDALLVAFAEDLEDGLREARARMAKLVAELSTGPDPLALIDVAYDVRARDGGRDLASKVTAKLVRRAHTCQALARYDELAEQLVPRLLEADRRRASLG